MPTANSRRMPSPFTRSPTTSTCTGATVSTKCRLQPDDLLHRISDDSRHALGRQFLQAQCREVHPALNAVSRRVGNHRFDAQIIPAANETDGSAAKGVNIAQVRWRAALRREVDNDVREGIRIGATL